MWIARRDTSRPRCAVPVAKWGVLPWVGIPTRCCRSHDLTAESVVDGIVEAAVDVTATGMKVCEVLNLVALQPTVVAISHAPIHARFTHEDYCRPDRLWVPW